MKRAGGVRVHLQHEVRDLQAAPDGSWRADGQGPRRRATSQHVGARFVFLGAGGRALPLLLNSGIPEASGYGGFPGQRQWLVC